ncbi:MAG: bifunctional glycosyltransferase family 2/GtrA family protein [Firmicutes bacterium]|nr:bifunctional glycosyltransferase family 2/GtrA family protein [Bacillota bacterium]
MENTRIALVPAYEPEQLLVRVVNELTQKGFEVIVVDDGSSEDKKQIFEEVIRQCPDTILLAHPLNRGKGAALKTGLAYIRRRYAAPYTVITVDADGQHQTDDALRVALLSEKEPQALVLGSRRFTGKVPLKSRLGGMITRLVYRLSSGVRVYDTQTGLRGFSSELIGTLLDIPGDRYEYEMNMLMQFAKEKGPIREVWIETIYLNDNASSHFNPWKDSIRIYKEILKFSASSLISFGLDYLLFCLLLPLTGSAVFANIDARIISAAANYTLNRRMVFNSRAPIGKSALQYALLAGFVLVLNTLMLKVLVSAGISSYLAKILTEIFMWVVSFQVQHKLIFPAVKGARYEKA